MKLEKKHWMIIGVVVAIILVWYFFIRKKNGKNLLSKLSPSLNQAPNQAELDKIKEEKTKQKQESSFRAFRGGGGGGFRGGFHRPHPGPRPWGGWGWGYPSYPVPYYDLYEEPIVINSTRCPEGWVWMGAMLGCQKPPVQ